MTITFATNSALKLVNFSIQQLAISLKSVKHLRRLSISLLKITRTYQKREKIQKISLKLFEVWRKQKENQIKKMKNSRFLEFIIDKVLLSWLVSSSQNHSDHLVSLQWFTNWRKNIKGFDFHVSTCRMGNAGWNGIWKGSRWKWIHLRSNHKLNVVVRFFCNFFIFYFGINWRLCEWFKHDI